MSARIFLLSPEKAIEFIKKLNEPGNVIVSSSKDDEKAMPEMSAYAKAMMLKHMQREMGHTISKIPTGFISFNCDLKPIIPTFYVNKAKKTIVCKLGKKTTKVKLQDGDTWHEYTGLLASYVKAIVGLNVINKAHIERVPCEEAEAPIEAPKAVELAIDEQPQQFASFVPQPDCGFTFSVKDKESFHFKPTGVDGVYISDCAVFKAPFDKDGCNDWEKSSGKKLLEQWFKEHAPIEIQEQFDIDIPTVEEVFSQKMINWWGGDSVKGLVSKQFPIFKDSDERMKEFEGKPIWWWTRSASAGSADLVWGVETDGGIGINSAYYAYGFVPVLRRKSQESTNPDRKVEKVGSSKKKAKSKK